MSVKRKKQNIHFVGHSFDIKKENFLAVSFCYFTNNKKFNFEKLDKNQKREWEAALTERIIELTQQDWIYWGRLSKDQGGYETLNAEQVKLSPSDYTFSVDENVIVFRFNKQNGRIIGFKKCNNPTLFIIGIDTDYSAYNHGS